MRKTMNDIFGAHCAYDFFCEVRWAVSEARYVMHEKYNRARMGSIEEQVAKQYIDTYGWKTREERRDVHPTVRLALKKFGFPDNLHLLVLQYPHLPQDGDALRVAYTQSERKGQDDKQTVTAIGKYIRQHWSSVPDHEVRDLCAIESLSVEIIDDMDRIVELMSHPDMPSSCMSGDDGDYRNDHPYRVYAKEFGWQFAIGRDADGKVNSRAIVFEGDVDGEYHKCFVRTYTTRGDYQRSERLDARLKAMGYEHRNGYPVGAKLKYISYDSGDGFTCPYVDGDTHWVDLNTRHETLELRRSGEYDTHDADRDDGIYYINGKCTCEDCGANVSEDELHYIESSERSVCTRCIDRNYVEAIYNHRGWTQLVNVSDAVQCVTNDNWYEENHAREVLVRVDGDWYETDDDDIIYCETDGGYCHRDEVDNGDIVYIEDKGEYYRADDDAVTQCQTTLQWMLVDDIDTDVHVLCVTDSKWYRKDDPNMAYGKQTDCYYHMINDNDVVPLHNEGWAHRTDCVYLIQTRGYMTIDEAQAEIEFATTQGE